MITLHKQKFSKMKNVLLSSDGLPTEFWITLGVVVLVIIIGGALASWSMKRNRMH